MSSILTLHVHNNHDLFLAYNNYFATLTGTYLTFPMYYPTSNVIKNAQLIDSSVSFLSFTPTPTCSGTSEGSVYRDKYPFPFIPPKRPLVFNDTVQQIQVYNLDVLPIKVNALDICGYVTLNQSSTVIVHES